MQIVLYQPRIPPNTGSIARLCAATETPLHLVGPLGFSIDDKHLKRAGLDYWPYVEVHEWSNWSAFIENLVPDSRLIMTSARKGKCYTEHDYQSGDMLVLGPETWGLPENIVQQGHVLITIPIWGKVRSLNLATAAAVVLYEGYRQTGGLKHFTK
ncbi:tRNA (cytidine(34)-2'-O)-methyltransferase [Desulfonatronovibrio magnus]|uniref:tRNA (cytidine(34)-2'-O)-methyltransferase n=1 Tax=Desulfonatronovibrio magnus TaxID=698827 RepID=UPI0005EB1B24|nr:tRNA (cytidine(34)-2'-O)-methyltransferase [Desulfonatronovibrio magnus]